MAKSRDSDRKILQELMKNSKISDRQLGKKLGISQATVTRRRRMLEREVIENYTFIPNWSKFGYEIFAISLIKSKQSLATLILFFEVLWKECCHGLTAIPVCREL